MTTPKLDDTQLVLLSAAAQRENGSLLPAPASLTAKPPQIKKALEALKAQLLIVEAPVTSPTEVWRQDDAERLGLAITEEGRSAINASASTEAESASGNALDCGAGPAKAKGAKQELLINLLAGPQGASIEEITAATCWLPHSARAMLTGLRKRGFAVTSDKGDGTRRYRAIKAEAAL
jgi:hypothetical protein